MDCEKLLANKPLVCFYFAVVLLLLLLVIMQLWKVGYYTAEHQVSHPVKMVNQQNTLFNGGHYGTELSGANGPTTSGLFPGLGTGDQSGYGMEAYTNPYLRNSEYLVNNRGEPDFWTITSDLQDYQLGETAAEHSSAGQVLAAAPQATGLSSTPEAAASAAQAAGASPVQAAAAAQGAAAAAAQPDATPASVGAAAQGAAASAGAPPTAAVAAGAAASERFRSEGLKALPMLSGMKMPWSRNEHQLSGFQKLDLRTSLHGRPAPQENFEGMLESALYGR
jgi:hypothetical protein